MILLNGPVFLSLLNIVKDFFRLCLLFRLLKILGYGEFSFEHDVNIAGLVTFFEEICMHRLIDRLEIIDEFLQTC